MDPIIVRLRNGTTEYGFLLGKDPNHGHLMVEQDGHITIFMGHFVTSCEPDPYNEQQSQLQLPQSSDFLTQEEALQHLMSYLKSNDIQHRLDEDLYIQDTLVASPYNRSENKAVQEILDRFRSLS